MTNFSETPQFDASAAHDWALGPGVKIAWMRQMMEGIIAQNPEADFDEFRVILGLALITIQDDGNCFALPSYDAETIPVVQQQLRTRLSIEQDIPEIPDDIQAQLDQMRLIANIDWTSEQDVFAASAYWREHVFTYLAHQIAQYPYLQESIDHAREIERRFEPLWRMFLNT